MPLLTELEKRSVGWHFYKHGAPSGASLSRRVSKSAERVKYPG